MARSFPNRRLAASMLAVVLPTAGAASDGGLRLDFDAPATAARGWISLGYQATASKGSLDAGGDQFPFLSELETNSHSMIVSVDYRLDPRWSVHASLPYVRKRAQNDPGSHDPTALASPRPASEFIDDGSYHSTWQDWQLGVTYHAALAGFEVRPHAVVTYPSRDYVFFASAAAGQRLARFRLGFDVSRRIGMSNAHYGFGYSYELVERILDRNLDKQHLRLTTRYDFSPELSASLFGNARRGNGAIPSDFFRDRPLGNERWYQHDRLLRQNFGFAGVGITWRLDPRWALFGARSWMVWGDSIHDVTYAYEMQLSRAF